MISHGGRYAGMAGASTALGGSIMDLHSNPALLGLSQTAELEAGLRFNYAESRYTDAFVDANPEFNYSNDHTSYMVAPLPYLGWQTPLNNAWSVGAVLYLVGGGGGEFTNITRMTPTGQNVQDFTGYPVPVGGNQKQLKESVYARMMHARLSAGISWKVDRLRAGISLSGAHSRMEMRQLLYDPGNHFELPGTGLRYKSDPAYTMTGNIGFTYDLLENLRLGYSWSGPTKFHMDGEMRVNVGDPRYYYHNRVSMQMAWPEQHRLGSYLKLGDWGISLDVGYINWSSYLSTLKFQMEQAVVTTPLGFDSSVLIMNLHTRDQTVIATGLEYDLAEDLQVRCGYNYARSNVGADGINPLFAVVTEHHFTIGAGIQSQDWIWDLALEYAAPGKQTGGNVSNWDIGHAVFGKDAVKTQQFTHSKSMQVWAFIISTRHQLN